MLKVMHPHLAKDPGYLERFHREARLAASITHPNVIRIFDVGQDGEAHYMALEYLPLSLHNLIQTQGHFPGDYPCLESRSYHIGRCHRRGDRPSHCQRGDRGPERG